MKSRLGSLSSRHLAGLMVLSLAVGAGRSEPPAYRKIQLSDRFFCEGAAWGGFNHYGQMDVVAGPYWSAGPDFKKRTEIYPAVLYDPRHYSENFFSFVHDFNGDGRADIVTANKHGTFLFLSEKPVPQK